MTLTSFIFCIVSLAVGFWAGRNMGKHEALYDFVKFPMKDYSKEKPPTRLSTQPGRGFISIKDRYSAQLSTLDESDRAVIESLIRIHRPNDAKWVLRAAANLSEKEAAERVLMKQF